MIASSVEPRRKATSASFEETARPAGELAAWIETVRGPTTSIVETTRPVDLDDYYLVDDRTDSGWTLTVAARLLRGAGAAAVHPLVLAVG